MVMSSYLRVTGLQDENLAGTHRTIAKTSVFTFSGISEHVFTMSALYRFEKVVLEHILNHMLSSIMFSYFHVNNFFLPHTIDGLLCLLRFVAVRC